MAPAVLAVGKDAHALSGGTKPDADISARLKSNQDVLAAVQPSLDADLKPSFDQLVIGIGIARIRIDSNTFAPALGTDLQKDYDAVVTACTG